MCSFVIVVVFMYLFRVTYVWTCGCAWLLGQESRDARPFADSRACVRVSARVCVRTIVDCGAYGFVRVFVLCRVPKCSCVACNWSRKRRAFHEFACVACSWASRAYVTVIVA